MPTVSELVIQVTADTSQVDSSISKVHKSVGGLGDSLSSGLGMGLGFGLVSKGIELVGSAFAAAKGSIIDLNSSLEQSKIAFTTMLGSAQAADTFLEQLQTFAAQTPFEFPDLVSASKRMLAFGFEAKNVVPLLTAVGNASAAIGGGAETIDGVTTALGQMQAKGKVSAEEMGQLAERGIPAWDMLAKKLGVDIPTAMDMVSKGAVKSGTFIEAFQEGVSERFGGMMERQALTFGGAMSTISDSIQMATAKAFKPLFDLLSEGAIALAGFLQSDMFTVWGSGVGRVVQSVADSIRGLMTVVTDSTGFIADAWRTVGQVFASDWSPSETIDPITNAVGRFATILRDVVMPAVSVVSTFIVEQFGVVVDWFVENWPLIRTTIEVVLTGILALWDEHGAAIMRIVKDVWTIVSTLIGTALRNLLDVIKLAMQLITGDWDGAWQTLLGIVDRTLKAWVTVIGAAFDLIFTLVDNRTGGLLTRIGEWLTNTKTAIETGFTNVTTAVQGAWDAIVLIHTVAMTGAGGILESVKSGWSALVTATTSALVDGPAALVTVVKNAWNAVTTAIGSAFNAAGSGILALASTAWSALVSTATTVLTQGPSSLVAVVTSAFGGVVTYLQGLVASGSAFLKAALDVGTGIVTSIKDGISSALGGFWSWLQTNFVDKIPSFVKELLGIHSPSSVMYDIGVNMVEGLRRGMASRLPSIDDLVAQTIAKFGGAGGDATGWIRAAMALTGVGDSWLSGLSWIAQHESSGNPRAVNPESVNGEHASGLFQTLPSTFRAYALPGMTDIWNPVHNAAAAIRYIQSAYVSRGRGLDWIIAHWAERGGYAEGGWAGLHGPELAWLGERGPEYVVPNHALGRGGSMDHVVLDVAIDGRTAERIYITGRDIALRRGRSTAGVGTAGNLLAGAPA